MELRHLRYFAAVAATCHFGQAAERLHLAQPALSQAVRQLEAELDVTLFTRTTRQVALTPAGQFMLDETTRILDALDSAVRGVRRIAAGRHGVVRLGLTGTASFSHFPAIARILKQELPGVALEVSADLLTPIQCERLRSGTLDLGILRPPTVGDGLTVRTIEAEPLILAVAEDHRLADAPVVAMSELRNEPFVVYSAQASAVNDAVVRSCHAAGFAPHREHEAPGTAILLALVAAGLGVALVPASARALPLDGVVFRDVADAGTVELAFAYRTGEDKPVLDAVLDVLENAGILRDATPERVR